MSTQSASSSDQVLVGDGIIAGYLPGVDILTGVHFELNAGELVGIIGPNGAGKSTLLKAMFGLVPVREGAVRLHGDVITNMAAHSLVEKGVGFVPQTENVFPSLTITENLEMGAYQLPKGEIPDRLQSVIELFPKLGERSKQRAGLLSGGERQMLAMGRALMMQPTVLLLDEPSAGLSPAYQGEVFDNVRSINATGVSIVMVEQNAQRCLRISDRALRPRQRQERLRRPRPRSTHRPQGHRALPRHPRKTELEAREGFDDGGEGFGVADHEVADEKVFAESFDLVDDLLERT